MQCTDFPDGPYEPTDDGLVCAFRLVPEAGLSAVEAHRDGDSVQSRAGSVPELATALDKWGTDWPR